MKTFLSILLFLILSCSQDNAQLSSYNENNFDYVDKSIITDMGFECIETVYDDFGKPAFYVVNTDDTFLILSANYATKPIIGYGKGNLDINNIQVPSMRYLFEQ